MATQPQIFLTYSHRDSLFVDQLVKTLRSEQYNIWWDSSILPGEEWQKSIQEALRESDVMILILSPASLQSEWVRAEYQHFLQYKKPILPILIHKGIELPQELYHIQILDSTDGLNEHNLSQLKNALDQLLGRSPAPPPPAPPAHLQSPPTPTAATEEQRKYDIVTRALSDKPTEDDLLGFNTYAEALAGFILHQNTDKPLTIAINAVWGSGKSSLMYMIRRELHRQTQVRRLEAWRDGWKQRQLGFIADASQAVRKGAAGIRDAVRTLFRRPKKKEVIRSPLPTVWFNAWKYDEEEALWAALALSVIHQVAEQSNVLRRLWFKLQLRGFNVMQLLWDMLKALLSLFVIAGIGILAVIVIGSLQGKTFASTAQEVVISIAVGGAVAAFQLGNSIIKSSKDLLNLRMERYMRTQPNYAEKIGFLAEFEDDFKRLVSVVTRDGKYPLVIFIDDLDRCAVPKAADLIEAINIFLNTDYCVFIIGMDVRTVAASIEVRYEKLREYLNADNTDKLKLMLGQQFLEKIVQIIFPIPQPDSSAMKNFIEGNLNRELRDLTQSEQAQVAAAKEDLRDRLGKVTSVGDIQSKAGQIDLGSNAEAAQRLRQEVIGETILENFDNLKEVKKVLEEMLHYLDYNPRRVKRFINVFRLQAFIAVRRGTLTDARQLASLGAWLEIAFKWPEFIRLMLDSPRFDDDLYAAHKAQERVAQLGGNTQAPPELREELALYRARPEIKKFMEEVELIKLLPNTTSFGDDEVVPILLPALQIAVSTPIVKMH